MVYRSTKLSGWTRRRQFQQLYLEQQLKIGIDVGSTSSDVVVLDSAGRMVFCSYQRTKGRPFGVVRLQLRELFRVVNPGSVIFMAATGSVGRLVAKLLSIPFVNEVSAQAAAIHHLYPSLREATIIEMGGQDSKLIFIRSENGRNTIKSFALNGACAAGTGAFLDQQAQRLGVNIEDEFSQFAMQSKNVPQMAGRCSVFAKSDMIHLQQQATPVCDIIAGLCLALARNLKSNLSCGRELVRPIVFTGGVAANAGVVRAMERVFEPGPGGLVVPEEHFFTGAIGAVLVTESGSVHKSHHNTVSIESLEDCFSQAGAVFTEAPRREPLKKPVLPPPQSRVCGHLLDDATEPIRAYLGVDVGSISTNVVVIDEQRRVLSKAYLMTAGRPLEAVRQGMEIVGREVAGKVKILGAGTTGSGRYLTGDFIGADVVINEITAQATGAFIVNPKVDTIFEIGGQDSKYISLENGVVVDFEMNHACAAGTGSFLEEQAQRLGININEEFAELAFEGRAPVKLGERCTVFMESDLLSHQQQGVEMKELVAGLAYSIVANYLNRVVGRRRIGDNICFQGGTAFNKAVWAAFEQVLGKPIMVPDHHEVTGAIGAAAIACDYIERLVSKEGRAIESKFRGFECLAAVKYSVESFSCEHCPNHCDIKKVQMPGAEALYYGSRCDRYNLGKRQRKSAATSGEDAFEYRIGKLLEFAGFADREAGSGKAGVRIGIPMALVNWQLLPLFARFFKSLGFEVVLSGRTDRRIIQMGVERIPAQPCFPVKVAYGHVADLIERKVDWIFLPSIVSMTASFPENEHNQLCPYVQSFAYQVRTAFAGKLGDAKILTAPIRMCEGEKLLREGFVAIGRELGASTAAVRRAIKEGLSAQAGFERVVKEKGREILEKTGPGQRLFVLVGRSYNGCDEGVNLHLVKKLKELGVQIMPLDMLNLDGAYLGEPELHRRVYWVNGQKILRAAEVIKRDPRLFAIYLSNFSCGPDSFLLTFFKDIMGRKPCLQLELDEHSADAGLITRLEAFLESLKHYREADKQAFDKVSPAARAVGAAGYVGRDRKLYIPYMGDCAYGLAACFRAYGQQAEVMPMANESTLLQARQFTSGKECLPCTITAGDMLNVTKSAGFDPSKAAFFMPSGCGPCRFGMYNSLHKLILKYAGVEGVPIVSPNQDCGFYRELAEASNDMRIVFLKDMWIATVGIDLLHKLVMRLRPFAVNTERMQRVYDEAVKRWSRVAGERLSLGHKCRIMELNAEQFAAVELNRELRKPKVGIVGEIYVRNHPFANMNVIARLEELGAACELASVAEWVYYTNFTRKQQAVRRRQFRDWVSNMAQDCLQHKIERKLAEPLEKRFGRLAEEPIEHTLRLAEPYLHRSFEGEAALSVGKMVEYHHRGVGGVVNVMPFTCMPSTIVSTQTMRVSADCGGMPILNLSFDGQEDATLATRLEAFVEQVASSQRARVNVSQVLV
jgi:predicted CoA-substrate-specific enzyme activase